jgi:hypothetical protein
MTALLALHIESALNPTEPDLVRSMSRLSISQIMLLLYQGKQMPVLEMALPIFERILTRQNLYMVPSNMAGQVPTRSLSQETDLSNREASQPTQIKPLVRQFEDNQVLDLDFWGIDFSDDWQIGQMDFTG